MTLLAAIDIGSNAIRFAAGSISSSGKVILSHAAREPVRLGTDVFTKGEIAPRSCAEGVEAIVKFYELSQSMKVHSLRAVATSALRDARNRDSLLDEVKRRTGLSVQVIDGMEEARLIHLAISRTMTFEDDLTVLLDIGGGSIEISLADRESVKVSDSVNVGAVRLLQVIEERNYSLKNLSRFIEQHTYGIVKEIRRETKTTSLRTLVGTGGNLEALGELGAKLLGRPNQKRLSATDVDDLVNRLASLTVAERISQLNLRPDRADVILPAAALVQHISRTLNIEQVVVPGVGLREGILVDLFLEMPEHQVPLARHQPTVYALEVGRRLDFDERHALAVARHSAELFQQTKRMHRLSEDYGVLLEVAALLHDVGQAINMTGHHKHSYYIINAVSFLGLTKRQKQLVATIARYHRKAPPSLKHAEYAALSPDDREVVRKLSALLRIGDALDREHASKVSSFSSSMRGKEFVLELQGEGDLVLERWGLKKKSSLFEEVFGCKFVITD